MNFFRDEHIVYRKALSESDLEGIINLQRENLSYTLSESDLASEGFVTLQHSLSLLRKMNNPHPHIIATVDEKVIGYCLVMLNRWKKQFEVLLPMFEQIQGRSYKNKVLTEDRFFIMGQVCVEKNFRKKGVFYKMYDAMADIMSSDFDFIITEVAVRNSRSLNAHLNAQFDVLLEYGSDTEEWVIVIRDIRK